MAKTAQFDLPLVAPAQAQKHVTVNEALSRLDAAAQLRLTAMDQQDPPAGAPNGACYSVPAGAAGAWSGEDGKIAIRSNGGWVFLAPRAGWQAWDEGSFGRFTFDGSKWRHDAIAVSPGGAVTAQGVIEFDHEIVAGGTSLTAVEIPAMSQVVGVTGRVVSSLLGTGLSGWRIGVAGSDTRYGSGLGTAVNSYLVGLSGAPVTYYSDTPLILTAEGGTFSSGTVRLAIHLTRLAPPDEI